MLADIAVGKSGPAEICFIVAVILLLLAAFAWPRPEGRTIAVNIGWLGLAILAFGLVLL